MRFEGVFRDNRLFAGVFIVTCAVHGISRPGSMADKIARIDGLAERRPSRRGIPDTTTPGLPDCLDSVPATAWETTGGVFLAGRRAEIHAEMMTGDTHIMQWLQLIRAEYLEIPGLRLTKPEVQRLWGLDEVTAEALLSALIDVKFLRRTQHDAYVRVDVG